MKQKEKAIRPARFCDTGLHSVISLQQKISFIINAYHDELLLLSFISNQKETHLHANVMIIQAGYDTVYYYDVVGYSSSDVTSGALQV